MSRKYQNDTRQRLAEITDAGRFEELATAVLREADEHCRRVAHVGVNAEGKTIKSPVDGIVYISVAGERHLLAVHHTTSRKEALRGKWLSDQDSDLHKTLRELTAQRKADPDLGATLILTTNIEPGVQLLHDVENAGCKAGIEIKVWSGSALAHFLDIDPQGQWIRRTFLGVEPSRLSKELLGELSARSVTLAPLADDPERWVEREVDWRLRNRAPHRVQFVLGNSGAGKSVACLKCLQLHVQGGGFGLVVTDGVVESSLTVEEAIERTLRNLQPNLADGAGSDALSLGSENEEFLLVVEDVNGAAQPARLIEKIAAWGTRATTERDSRRWRILCPVWPRTLALASIKTDKIANEAAVSVALFARMEGIAAVRRRRPRVTDLEAEAVASALGFDPLLIALHGSTDATPEPATVIQSYIDRELRRVAAVHGTYTESEYRDGLRVLALEMLNRGRLEPTFSDVVNWTVEDPSIAAMLRDLARYREIVRLDETTQSQRVAFRHDRVRDHLLADATKDAISRDALPGEAIADPYFAEVIGMAIARDGVSLEAIGKVVEANPLALFCALRHCSRPEAEPAQQLVKEATKWAERGDWRDPPREALRIAVLRVLAECEGPHIKALCKTIGRDSADHWALRGRFRNGDLSAGVMLCAQLPPGVGWVGHVELIGHVAKKGGSTFIRALGDVLRNRDLPDAGRRGALRLAGFVASPELAGALRESWATDTSRKELLPDYFWACARCCSDDPVGLLEPVVDAWAAMPDEDEDGLGSPRVRFGAHELRWAFRDLVPKRAIGYFLQCARRPELRWPMLVMLHGIDNPDAVEFVVRELAEQDEQLEETGHFSPFAVTAVDEWSGRQISPSSKRDSVKRGGDPMSAASRERLAELWSCDALGKHLRRWALRFWSATMSGEDIAVLRTIDARSELGNLALYERTRRGDRMEFRHSWRSWKARVLVIGGRRDDTCGRMSSLIAWIARWLEGQTNRRMLAGC